MSLGGQNDRRQQPSSPSTGSSPPPHPIPPTPSSTTPVFFCEGTKSTPQRSSYSTGSRPRAPPITTSSNAPPLPSTRMPPSPLSPLPTYSPDGSRMESNGNYAKAPLSSPMNEKAGYFDSRGYPRSEGAYSESGPSHSSHRSSSPPRRPHLTIAPPKAAFIEPPSSSAFAPPSPRAVNFGDAPRTPKPTNQRDSQMWSRFSMMMHSQQLQEKKDSEKDSAWLNKRTRTKKRFFCLGWICAILVVGGVIGYVVWHFLTLEKQVEPTVLKLGGFNGEKTTSTAATVSVAADNSASLSPSNASTSSSRISSATSVVPTTTTSSRAVATAGNRVIASTTTTGRSAATTTAVPKRRLFRRHRIPQHH